MHIRTLSIFTVSPHPSSPVGSTISLFRFFKLTIPLQMSVQYLLEKFICYQQFHSWTILQNSKQGRQIIRSAVSGDAVLREVKTYFRLVKKNKGKYGKA